MSRWTHIRGVIELVSEPYEFKKINAPKPTGMRTKDNDEAWDAYWKEKMSKAYYPNPDKQFVLTAPELIKGVNGPYLSIEAYEYSLPRAQKYIDEAFRVLPQGELGWHPAIKQDQYDSGSSSSCAHYKCQKQAYKKAVADLYKNNGWGEMDLDFVEECFGLTLNWVHHCNHIVIGIREDIRHCSGMEMLDKLQQFFKYLREHEIEIEDGYLEWQDEYEDDRIYSWRQSRVEPDHDVEYKFMIANYKTNKVIYSKTFKHKKDDKGQTDWEAWSRGEYDVEEYNPKNISLEWEEC